MKIIYFLIMCCHKINGKLSESEKIEFCNTLDCDGSVGEKVCGLRKENGKNIYMLFENECSLLKYGCQVDADSAYGITNLQRCNEFTSQDDDVKTCPNCLSVENEPVCGIRSDGDGYRVRIFQNKCKLEKHNCEQDVEFSETNFYICIASTSNGTDVSDEGTGDNFQENLEKEVEAKVETYKETEDETTMEPLQEKNKVYKSFVVVGGSMSDLLNINQTVSNFFAATHVFDLPVKELPKNMNSESRRMLIKTFGPLKIYTPWIKIPENKTQDHDHIPLLRTCFHKCPKKCPNTYAPVCGVPGLLAREPSLMFQNHCYMDVAQCKMYWEDKSWTAQSSVYIESSFLFCLGDELNGLYRFLPFVRTLQHMGRLKSKGQFKFKMRNMKFFNMHRYPYRSMG